MSSEQKFSRISVTSDADDDVVIQAGAWQQPAFAEPASAVQSAVQSEPAPSFPDCGSEAAPRDDAPASEHTQSSSSAPAASGSDARSGSARPSGKARDEYRETTLEDLEVGKMSTMQKGIIVAAVLLVVAFVAYLLLK